MKPSAGSAWRLFVAAGLVLGSVCTVRVAMADLFDEPDPSTIAALVQAGRPIVATEQDAVDLAELHVRLWRGAMEAEAQRPFTVIGNGVTADGIAYWWVEGRKSELTSVDFLGLAMKVRIAVASDDARVLDFGFRHPALRAPSAEDLGLPPVAPTAGEADALGEPNRSFVQSLGQLGMGFVSTRQKARDLAELITRLAFGAMELEAQRPLRVVDEGMTPAGVAYWWVAGSDNDAADGDTSGPPAQVWLAIAKQDGRVLDIRLRLPAAQAPPGEELDPAAPPARESGVDDQGVD